MMNMATDTTQNLTEFSLTTCPATVRHFEVTTNDGHTAKLKWEPLEIPPTQYIIEWWETERPETIQRKFLPCTEYTIHLRGSDISIRVAAENEAGRSYTDTIQLPAAPKAPENIRVHNDATPGALLVQYSDPDASHKTYYVTATNVADNTDHVKESTAGRNIIIAGLKTGTLYEVEVHSESNGLLSLPVWHSSPVLTIPGRVQTISTTKISQYTWQAKWEEVHGAKSYDVHWRRVYDSNYKIVKSTANDITLPNLESDTAYEIRLAAQNASGQGPLSDPEFFKTDIPLLLPKNVTALPNTKNPETSLKVWFDEPQHKPESYTVMARTDGKFVTKQHVNENPLIVGGLEPGTEYSIYVHCGGGVTMLSDMASSAPVWTTPGRVTGVHASKRSATSYHVSWAKLHGATEYEIQYQANEDPKIVSENNALLDRLSYYTKYEVQVRGRNTGGEGKFSDAHEFLTSLGPPTDIEVRNNPDHPDTAINVNFNGPTPRAPLYKLVARSSRRGVDDVEIQTMKNGDIIEGLQPGVAYTVSVCSIIKDDDTQTSEEIRSKEILTCPGTTTNIGAVALSQNSYKIDWTPVSGAATYEIKIRKKEGGPEKTRTSKDHSLILGDLDRNQEYIVRITAKNAAGCGKDSEEIHFRTAFGPPTEVAVSTNDDNPKTSIVVKFAKPVPGADKYMVRLKNMSSKEPDIEKNCKRNIVTISGLKEGEKYQVFLRSMSDTNKLLDSAETEPVSIVTALPEMRKPACCAVTDGWKISWDPIPRARSYIVAWRIENNAWTEEATKHEEHILRGMESGKTYECRVYTVSDANKREGSKVAKFTVAPSTSGQPTYEILSPSEVLLKCDKCEGATSYEFKITSTDEEQEPITKSTQSPKCEVKVPFPNMAVTVIARNDGGNSSVSEQLKFRQVLTYLNQKFKKAAQDGLPRHGYLPLVSVEEPTKKSINLQNLRPKPGESYMVYGSPYSGKTSTCHKICTANEVKDLVMPLNLADASFQGQTDLKAFLHTYMMELEDHEMETVIQWIEENSHRATFALDDVTFPKGFQPRILPRDHNTTAPTIAYNLIRRDRKIFSQSKIIFFTDQRSLAAKLKPTKVIKIVGLHSSNTNLMRAKILGSAGHDQEELAHLGHFLSNPGFCEAIYRCISQVSCDITSKASVFVEALSQLFSRCTGEEKKRKIDHMMEDIHQTHSKELKAENTPQKVMAKKMNKAVRRVSEKEAEASVYSRSTVNISKTDQNEPNSEALYRTYLLAIHFAYKISENEFKKQFSEDALDTRHMSETMEIAAGLLNPKTAERAVKVLAPHFHVDEKIVLKKKKFLENFIKDHSEKIAAQVYITSQIALDWIRCCNELSNKELAMKCTKNLKIKNDLSPHALDQISDFIKKVPLYGWQLKINVKLNVKPGLQLTVDTARRGNRNPEAILFKDYKGSSPSGKGDDKKRKKEDVRTRHVLSDEDTFHSANGSVHNFQIPEEEVFPDGNENDHATGDSKSQSELPKEIGKENDTGTGDSRTKDGIPSKIVDGNGNGTGDSESQGELPTEKEEKGEEVKDTGTDTETKSEIPKEIGKQSCDEADDKSNEEIPKETDEGTTATTDSNATAPRDEKTDESDHRGKDGHADIEPQGTETAPEQI